MSPKRDLARTARVAEVIAIDAGAVLLEGWGTRPDSRAKSSATDLVTEYDGRSEALVVKRLQDAFPDDAIVAEEGSRVGRSDAEWVWYVDPLDGTTNFTHGLPFFAVSLGLSRGGARDPVLGVVHAPAINMTFTGWEGGGARRNGAPAEISRVDSLDRALIATGFPYSPTAPHKNFAEWEQITPLTQGTRRLGSAALDLSFVACGWYEGFWERHISAWDLVGGAAIVLAAGGAVTDVDGGPFDGTTGRVLATNGLVHEPLRALLERSAREGKRPWP